MKFAALIKNAACSSTGSTALILGNAIFWAGAILLASWLQMAPADDSMVVPGLLTACWFAVHCLIQRSSTAGPA